jgi:homoserine kinase
VVEISLSDGSDHRVLVQGSAPALVEPWVLRGVRAFWDEFKALDRRPPALDISCRAEIPANCGLGDREAWIVGGLDALNNLLGAVLPRERIARIAVRLSPSPAAAITALLGGLTVTSVPDDDEPFVYRRLEAASQRVILVVPVVNNYRAAAEALPLELTSQRFRDALSHTVLVAEALRSGDYTLLGTAMRDRVLEPRRAALIPGYTAAIAAAHQAGAAAASLCGVGPACVIFTAKNHAEIQAAVTAQFAETGIKAYTWVLPVDTQGVAINLIG